MLSSCLQPVNRHILRLLFGFIFCYWLSREMDVLFVSIKKVSVVLTALVKTTP